MNFAHSFYRLKCVYGMIQTSNDVIYNTPKSPENHAKQIRLKADQCKGKDERIKE
jgi:hypothetical protein